MEKLKEKIISSYPFIVFMQRPFEGNGSFLRILHMLFDGYGCFVFGISAGVVKIYIFYSDFL